MKTLNKIICLLFSLLIIVACNNTDKKDGLPTVTITVSPSNKIIAECEGGIISFEITVSDPNISIRYISNATWIKQINENETKWEIEANTSEMSRTGFIYIVEESSLERIDSIEIVQKSINNEIQGEQFTETEVPVYIPFAGNSYITTPNNSNFIDNNTGKFVADWTDPSIVASTYFYVNGSGELNLAVVGCNNTGNSLLRFTVQGKSFDVRIDGPSSKIYTVAKLNLEKPGYIRVDVKGISKSGANFGEIIGYRIGNTAASGKSYFVTDEYISQDINNCYFSRRGASVHWFYTQPSSDVEYFYNEIEIAPEDAVNSSYYMMNGFGQGYMGIQQTTTGKRTVLFSVWSPYSTDDPNDIPEDERVKVLRKGKDVTIGEFGNEGSGGQSWLNYEWEPGKTYKALVGIKPGNDGGSVYTAYFYADNEWKLIASFWRPKTTTWYTGAYSFLENFDPQNSIYNRSVSYKNQWMKLSNNGEWIEITNATFSCDVTGKNNMRYDYSGKVDSDKNTFILSSFGFTDEHTEYGTVFNRKPTGTPPDIDFNALENIPSFN